jgi:hypothetical protein
MMETDPASALVHGYLDRLRAAGWTLDPARRDELVDEVREHIEAGLQLEPPGSRGTEVAARNVLERLGPPEDIVRAELEGTADPTTGTVPNQADVSWGGLEIGAVVALAVGSVIPFLGLFVGLLLGTCLAWASPRWRRSEKLIATAIAWGPLLFVYFLRPFLA